MTILLAAIAGNVLARMVHAATWWLREKCLWLLAICGFVLNGLSAVAAFLSVMVGYGMGMSHGDTSAAENAAINAQADKDIVRMLTIWLALTIVLALVGCWHRRLLKSKSKTRYAFSVGAVYAEAIAPSFFLLPFVENIARTSSGLTWNDVNDNKSYFRWAFWASLLLLAIFRPLVVRYSQRFRNLIRPECTDSTT